MEIEMSLVLDMWELIIENVPTARKEEIATKFVSILANQGMERSHFDSVYGEDSYLDNAVDHFFSDDTDEYDRSYDDDYEEL